MGPYEGLDARMVMQAYVLVLIEDGHNYLDKITQTNEWLLRQESNLC